MMKISLWFFLSFCVFLVSSVVTFLRFTSSSTNHCSAKPSGENQIADFYATFFPGFYPTERNSRTWGQHWTEWDNVMRVGWSAVSRSPLLKPLNVSHALVMDGRSDVVVDYQVSTAVEYGIKGFVIHHYWFDGKPELFEVMDKLVNRNLKFVFNFANEDWTKTWDGSAEDITARVAYHIGLVNFHMDWLAPYFRRSNYLYISGQPAMFIYRPEKFEGDASALIESLRSGAKERGFKGLYVMAYRNMGDMEKPVPSWADASVDYVPHFFTEPLGHSPPRLSNAAQDHYFGCFTSWDNTPRYLGRAIESQGRTHPYNFESSMRDTLNKILWGQRREQSRPNMAFINAFNEWGEGMVLAPSQVYGYSFLAVLKSFADASVGTDGIRLVPHPLLESVCVGLYADADEKGLHSAFLKAERILLDAKQVNRVVILYAGTERLLSEPRGAKIDHDLKQKVVYLNAFEALGGFLMDAISQQQLIKLLQSDIRILFDALLWSRSCGSLRYFLPDRSDNSVCSSADFLDLTFAPRLARRFQMAPIVLLSSPSCVLLDMWKVEAEKVRFGISEAYWGKRHSRIDGRYKVINLEQMVFDLFARVTLWQSKWHFISVPRRRSTSLPRGQVELESFKEGQQVYLELVQTECFLEFCTKSYYELQPDVYHVRDKYPAFIHFSQSGWGENRTYTFAESSHFAFEQRLVSQFRDFCSFTWFKEMRLSTGPLTFALPQLDSVDLFEMPKERHLKRDCSFVVVLHDVARTGAVEMVFQLAKLIKILPALQISLRDSSVHDICFIMGDKPLNDVTQFVRELSEPSFIVAVYHGDIPALLVRHVHLNTKAVILLTLKTFSLAQFVKEALLSKMTGAEKPKILGYVHEHCCGSYFAEDVAAIRPQDWSSFDKLLFVSSFMRASYVPIVFGRGPSLFTLENWWIPDKTRNVLPCENKQEYDGTTFPGNWSAFLNSVKKINPQWNGTVKECEERLLSSMKTGRVLMLIGSWTHRKRYDLCYSACEKAGGVVPGLLCLHAGIWDDAFKASKHVLRLGFIPHEQILWLTARSLFHFTLSREETFMLTILQAALVGTATISTPHVGAQMQIVSNVTGIIFSEETLFEDDAALQEATHYLSLIADSSSVKRFKEMGVASCRKAQEAIKQSKADRLAKVEKILFSGNSARPQSEFYFFDGVVLDLSKDSSSGLKEDLLKLKGQQALLLAINCTDANVKALIEHFSAVYGIELELACFSTSHDAQNSELRKWVQGGRGKGQKRADRIVLENIKRIGRKKEEKSRS